PCWRFPDFWKLFLNIGSPTCWRGRPWKLSIGSIPEPAAGHGGTMQKTSRHLSCGKSRTGPLCSFAVIKDGIRFQTNFSAPESAFGKLRFTEPCRDLRSLNAILTVLFFSAPQR